MTLFSDMNIFFNFNFNFFFGVIQLVMQQTKEIGTIK